MMAMHIGITPLPNPIPRPRPTPKNVLPTSLQHKQETRSDFIYQSHSDITEKYIV